MIINYTKLNYKMKNMIDYVLKDTLVEEGKALIEVMLFHKSMSDDDDDDDDDDNKMSRRTLMEWSKKVLMNIVISTKDDLSVSSVQFSPWG